MIVPHALPDPSLAGDALDPGRLRALVEELAASPAAWAARVRHDPGERLTELLWRDERVEVWLICWSGEEHDTGFHDHDESNGALAVAARRLVEERLALSGAIRRAAGGRPSRWPSRPRTCTASRGSAAGPAVSIHAYSPPLRRLGVYSVGDDGALRREPVAASHELGT